MGIYADAFETSVTVRRPPAAVWAALTDWERGPEWMGDGVERVDPPREGITKNLAMITVHARGKERDASIQNCEPPNALNLVSLQRGIMVVHRYALEHADDGNTHVHLGVKVTTQWYARLFRGMVVKSIRQADLGQLERFKAYAESR